MQGFFSKAHLASKKPPLPRIPQCGACGLYKTCNTPKMPVSGDGRKGILIVSESPGKAEDLQGVPYIYSPEHVMERTFKRAGVDIRRDCWLTYAVICYPGEKGIDRKTIDRCRPNVTNTIEHLNPKVIITLGANAAKSVLTPSLWDDDFDSITRWAGWRIPNHKPNAWICPLWSPSWVGRENEKAKGNSVAQLWFKRHVEAALQLTERPWQNVPDYNSMIERITDPRKAAIIIRKFIKTGGLTAFDYETNKKKPDGDDACIVSCSICWKGVRTIAYPFIGEAVDATREYLLSKCEKVGSNIKFEDRWSRRILGVRVQNWKHDTMLGSHVLDNRRRITSIKFQSFVMLGFPTYDAHIKPFLKEKKGMRVNQILEEIDLDKLLLYNGLDSLLEYEVAVRQMHQAALKSLLPKGIE